MLRHLEEFLSPTNISTVSLSTEYSKDLEVCNLSGDLDSLWIYLLCTRYTMVRNKLSPSTDVNFFIPHNTVEFCLHSFV
jgi:hypothetical protein